MQVFRTCENSVVQTELHKYKKETDTFRSNLTSFTRKLTNKHTY